MPPRKQRDPSPRTNLPTINLSCIELIPTFSGEGDIKNFLDRIDEVSQLTRWSELEKLTIAKLKLTGAAETFFRADPLNAAVDSFQDFSARLKQRFQQQIPLATQLQNLAACSQGEYESVAEYATRIRVIGNQIFSSCGSGRAPETRQANDRLLQARFVAGLKPSIQRLVLSRAPRSFEDSVTVAQTEEINEAVFLKSTTEPEGAVAQASDSITQLTEQVQKLTLQVQTLHSQLPVNTSYTQNQKFRNSRPTIRCYYCGNLGHVQAQCRKYRAATRDRYDTQRQQRSNSRERGSEFSPERNLNFQGRRQ